MSGPAHLLSVYHSERHAALLKAIRQSGAFHVGRLFLLQGLPGVGPALAHRLLGHFGSIERVLSADASSLAEVRGVGAKKAARIRKLVR